jgi:hypothetical protein
LPRARFRCGSAISQPVKYLTISQRLIRRRNLERS